MRHAGPEQQCASRSLRRHHVNNLQASKPDSYTFGGFFTRGGRGGGTSNPVTNARTAQPISREGDSLLLRHPNGGDSLSAANGQLVMCERKPPQRYVELAGEYERPARAGGKATFFAGHDEFAYTDNVLGALNGGGAMSV